jgi:hypothetical protein
MTASQRPPARAEVRAASPVPTQVAGVADASRTLRALGYLDLAALALALPVFLVGGFSMLGYAVAAGAWLFQRVVRELVARRAAAASDVRTSIGLNAASMILRGWLVAFAIFAVGVRDPKAGLAAAVLFLFLFSIFFTMQAIVRPSGRPHPTTAPAREPGAPAGARAAPSRRSDP